MGRDDGFGPPLGAEPAAPRRAPADDGFGPPLGREARGGRRRGADRDDFGPAVQGRRNPLSGRAPRVPRLPRPGWRVLRTLAVLLLTVTLVALGSGLALAAYATLSMKRVEVAGLQPITGGVMNVLVVGSDSRDGLTPEQLEALGTEAVAGRRTDSIFLLSVRGGAAAILSFPRDLYVQRCDGSNGRINGAFSDSNGPSCLVETVSRASGIPVTHYLEVNFAGFVQLVDAVGGVDVFLEQPMADAAAGVDLPQGCNTLDGRTGLGFVRARTIDSDLGRIARQQRFVAQLAKAIVKPATLLNPLRLVRATSAGAGALTADSGLGVIDLLRLVRAGRGLAAGGLATYTVPATPDVIAGANVLVPGDDADDLYGRFRDGSVLDVPAGAVTPAEFTVDVFNGAGVQGVASRGRDLLTARGFRVGLVDNAEAVEETLVRHAPGFEGAAGLVAQQLPGVTVEATAQGTSDVALVLGPDAPGLLDAATAAPQPAPAPAPGAPAPAPAPPAMPLGSGPVPAEC